MLQQRTITNPIKAMGVGLHSGKKVILELLPAPADSGINFIRSDLEPNVEIPAIFEHVGDTTLSTTLYKEGSRIATIEHLLSAIAGLGVDNCIIKVNGPEIPIMDGSAGPFVFLIQSAGITQQDKIKKFIKVKKEVRVERGDSFAAIKPFDGFKVSFTIEFDDPTINKYASTSSIDFPQHPSLKRFAEQEPLDQQKIWITYNLKIWLWEPALQMQLQLEKTGLLMKKGYVLMMSL